MSAYGTKLFYGINCARIDSCNIIVSLNSNWTIAFTFGLMPLGRKVKTSNLPSSGLNSATTVQQEWLWY